MSDFAVWGGCGGLGRGNSVNRIFTCTHTHTPHATTGKILLHLHTDVMLRYWTVSCSSPHTHTHTSWYPTGRALDVNMELCNAFMILCSGIMMGLCYSFIMWCSDIPMGVCNAVSFIGIGEIWLTYIYRMENSMSACRQKNIQQSKEKSFFDCKSGHAQTVLCQLYPGQCGDFTISQLINMLPRWHGPSTQ